MFDWLTRWRGDWFLEGWDTFSGESYPIPGRYRSEDAAIRAAQRDVGHRASAATVKPAL